MENGCHHTVLRGSQCDGIGELTRRYPAVIVETSCNQVCCTWHVIFQQDNAPTHSARETIQLPQRETSDFIAPDLWPSNSPDLSPVNYKIWSIVQQRVYETGINNKVGTVKQRLTELKSGADCFETLSTRVNGTTSSLLVFEHKGDISNFYYRTDSSLRQQSCQ